MKPDKSKRIFSAICVGGMMAGSVPALLSAAPPADPPAAPFGRIEISTLPFPSNLALESATYLPSGRVLVSYRKRADEAARHLNLAVMDDDGSHLTPIFSQVVPTREKDNGLRLMPFPDNKRLFLGDFVMECAPSLDNCAKSSLTPVAFPAEVARGDHVAHRWSEIIVSPDNRHIAWTTLLANYSAVVFVGELRRQGKAYRIDDVRIVSTLDPFSKDPRHPDGVLPRPVLGGEVKQFVAGGTAISVVGAVRRDTPDSVIQHLDTGTKETVTDGPGYTETTIFSPDERLGLTMSTRFSPRTDPAILGLMPRPYPDALSLDLSMVAYTYAVTGVRGERSGNIGPALIDIAASKAGPNYQGVNLSREKDWVFRSPMSWHPGGTRGMWVEGQRGTNKIRARVVHLPDYRPSAHVTPRPLPRTLPNSSRDLSAVLAFARSSQDVDVKVYGQKSGYIRFRKTPGGVTEKTYFDFSDDGLMIYVGSERFVSDPRARSTYTADVTLTGAKRGVMKLTMTFGPLEGRLPAEIIFSPDASGQPSTRGYVEYEDQRLNAAALLP